MDEILMRHKKIWEKKKILRKVYDEWYRRIITDLKNGSGKTVELGAGSGNFKEFKPDAISSDIEPCPWLDLCFDAHQMPFADGEISNLVMIDVFHHLADPLRFLHEAYRVLAPGGRIVMVEPYPSFFSKIVYRIFHPEPFIFNVDYFNAAMRPEKDPWQSNQAIPYLMFFKDIKKINGLFADKFSVVKRERISYLLYPLSGGFENRQLIPNFLIPLFGRLEKILSPFGKWLAFRCYLVLEKR